MWVGFFFLCWAFFKSFRVFLLECFFIRDFFFLFFGVYIRKILYQKKGLEIRFFYRVQLGMNLNFIITYMRGQVYEESWSQENERSRGFFYVQEYFYEGWNGRINFCKGGGFRGQISLKGQFINQLDGRNNGIERRDVEKVKLIRLNRVLEGRVESFICKFMCSWQVSVVYTCLVLVQG